MIRSNPPTIHHAEHLAKLRKQCTKGNSGPLDILKKFKLFKISLNTTNASSSSSSLIDNVDTINTEKKTNNKKLQQESYDEEMNFDGLESLTDLQEQDNNNNNNNISKPKGRAANFTV